MGRKLMPKETTAPAEISELSRETKARVKRRVEKRLRGLELESTGFLTARLNQIQGHGRITLVVVLLNEEGDARDEHLWGQCYHHLCVVRYVVPIGNQPLPLHTTKCSLGLLEQTKALNSSGHMYCTSCGVGSHKSPQSQERRRLPPADLLPTPCS